MRVVAAQWLGLALLVLAAAYISLAGAAIVEDETNGVETAFIVDSVGGRQPLQRVWTGYFYAIPKLEGTIQVRCRGGVRKEWGYITGYSNLKLRVVGDRPCARLVEAH